MASVRSSVRSSVRPTVRLSPYNLKSGHGVRLNLECQQSPRPGEGYRQMKNQKILKTLFLANF